MDHPMLLLERFIFILLCNHVSLSFLLELCIIFLENFKFLLQFRFFFPLKNSLFSIVFHVPPHCVIQFLLFLVHLLPQLIVLSP
jgi:hypothetical protein